MEKILIAVPTSQRHEYVLDDFLRHIRSLTHPNIHLLLYDNTLDNGEYYEKLVEKTPEKWIKIKRHEWNPDFQTPTQMLAHVREKMRHYFLVNDFTHYFDVASDFILPESIVERLIAHQKDVVGCVTHIFQNKDKMPAIIKWNGSMDNSGFITNENGLDLMSWKEVSKQKGLVRVWGCGVSLIQRKVLKKCQFRTHPTFFYGEDLWFFTEVNENNFEWWCDMDMKIEHRNTDWNGIPNPHRQGIFFAIGPQKAKGIEFRTGVKKEVV